MALNKFICDFCGDVRDSFKKEPQCNHNQEEEGTPHPVTTMTKLLIAPQAKMMEARDKERGKSVLKGLNSILKERASEDSRKNDFDDFIQEHKDNPTLAKVQGWLNADGTKKKRIDRT